MPIYEYQCPECNNIFEEWLNISQATQNSPCPKCNAQASRIISNTAFVLKGGGWYVTEYGNRKNTNNGASKTIDSKQASTTKSDASSTNTEPASLPKVDNSNNQAQSASA